MKSYKFSIIVPIYNVDKYLNHCIDSIICQTYSNLEIILVNDGSTDNSLEICKFYQEKDSRVKLIDKQNGGLSDARNAGIKIAKGDYILFIDGDDFYGNDFIEEINNLINKDKKIIDIVFANSYNAYLPKGKTIENNNGFTNENLKFKDGIDAFTYIIENAKYNCWSACMCIFRRELICNENIYFKKGIYCEDLEWTPKIYLKSKEVRIYEKPYYNYRLNRPNSIMNTCSYKKIDDLYEIINYWNKFFESHKEYYNLGKAFKKRTGLNFKEYLKYIYFLEKNDRDSIIKKIKNDRFIEIIEDKKIRTSIFLFGYNIVLIFLNYKYSLREFIKRSCIRLNLIDR